MVRQCHLRNVQDLLSDGKTPYERRCGEPSEGPVISFGSMIEYHPVSAKHQSRLHQFGKKCYLDYSTVTSCMRVESGKEIFRSQTLRSRKRWTHLKSTKEVLMPKKW